MLRCCGVDGATNAEFSVPPESSQQTHGTGNAHGNLEVQLGASGLLRPVATPLPLLHCCLPPLHRSHATLVSAVQSAHTNSILELKQAASLTFHSCMVSTSQSGATQNSGAAAAAVPSMVQLLLLRAETQRFDACLCGGGGAFPPRLHLLRAPLLLRRRRRRCALCRRRGPGAPAHARHPVAQHRHD